MSLSSKQEQNLHWLSFLFTIYWRVVIWINYRHRFVKKMWLDYHHFMKQLCFHKLSIHSIILMGSSWLLFYLVHILVDEFQSTSEKFHMFIQTDQLSHQGIMVSHYLWERNSISNTNSATSRIHVLSISIIRHHNYLIGWWQFIGVDLIRIEFKGWD